MPTYSIDGPDGKTYSVDGPPGASREQVIAQITKQMGQPPAPSAAMETVKDIGRGAAYGIARGLEELPQQIPFAGVRKAVSIATAPIAGKLKEYGPVEQTKKYVSPPQGPAGIAAEYVGEALPTAPLQPGGPITKAVTTLGIGLGEFGGEAAAIELGLPPWVGRFVGSMLGGGLFGGGAQAVAERRARRLLPTGEDNRVSAKAAYDQIAQAGLGIQPTEVQQFAQGLRADLRNNLFSPQPGGRGNVGFHAAELIEQTNGDLATLMNVHNNLGTVRPNEGANYAAALEVRDQIREWIANLQPNQLVRGDAQFIAGMWEHAREAWRTHSNLEDIKGALESAEWRRLASGRGTNLNTIRQEIRKIIDNDNKARKFEPEAREQMERIVEGDMARNVLRKIAAFAPHGSVSSIPTIAALHYSTPSGIAVAVGTFLPHFLSGILEEASVQRLTDIVREQSPLMTAQARRARASVLAPGRASVAAARGVLAAGADSPLAEGPPQE